MWSSRPTSVLLSEWCTKIREGKMSPSKKKLYYQPQKPPWGNPTKIYTKKASWYTKRVSKEDSKPTLQKLPYSPSPSPAKYTTFCQLCSIMGSPWLSRHWSTKRCTTAQFLPNYWVFLALILKYSSISLRRSLKFVFVHCSPYFLQVCIFIT